MAPGAEADVLPSLGPSYGPTCGACHGEGRVTQGTKASAAGPVTWYRRRCALCEGRGRAAWPWPWAPFQRTALRSR